MNKLDFAYRSLGICEEVCREKQAELAEIKAQRDAFLAAQQWRDIESAPRDGVTRILVLIGDGSDESIQTVAVRDTGNGCWVSSWTGEVLYPPTHWQPLPPPPEAKARGESV